MPIGRSLVFAGGTRDSPYEDTTQVSVFSLDDETWSDMEPTGLPLSREHVVVNVVVLVAV